jgi:hypothetical protein
MKEVYIQIQALLPYLAYIKNEMFNVVIEYYHQMRWLIAYTKSAVNSNQEYIIA